MPPDNSAGLPTPNWQATTETINLARHRLILTPKPDPQLPEQLLATYGLDVGNLWLLALLIVDFETMMNRVKGILENMPPGVTGLGRAQKRELVNTMYPQCSALLLKLATHLPEGAEASLVPPAPWVTPDPSQFKWRAVQLQPHHRQAAAEILGANDPIPAAEIYEAAFRWLGIEQPGAFTALVTLDLIVKMVEGALPEGADPELQRRMLNLAFALIHNGYVMELN